MENKEEIKTHNKETLPDGWKRVRLGEVVLEKPKSKLNVKDADNSGLFLFFTSGTEVLTHSKFLVDSENLFIADGGIANVKYYKGKAGYSNHVYCLQAKELGFFLYYIILHRIDEITNKFFTGTGLKNLNKPLFKREFLINIPPLPEQCKIAEILSIAAKAIEKTDQIIEKYKRIKQGLMQDLLTKGIDENGQIRSEKTHKFKDSSLGRIPEEWRVVRLGEILAFKNGINFSQEEKSENGILTLDVLNMYTEKIYVNFSNVYKVNKKLSLNYLLKDGDVLFVRSSVKNEGVGWTSLYRDVGENATFCGFIIRGRKKQNGISSEYITYYLRSDIGRNALIGKSGQLAITNISQENLKQTLLPLPPLPEQERIASILSQIDETIEKKVQYKEKLERIKQGLMEDLLTGKVRVNNLIKEVSLQ